ncbi:MAG: hypothetical protein A4E53_00172 [Pelotomaculum sp. PtaB.Bin104]|nr:MAG: hypothetical protein A4E53_00172 [Pelotomaculum sp. PtaB.Bin104]OPY60717.1 MAG: hypothetical protein A4E56_02520 [Pelotomaculum sp. PtaU1.Bin065]
MREKFVKFNRHISTTILTAGLLFFSRVLPARADNPDITTGLPQMDAATFSAKILKIALGVGALDGVLAAAMLIFLGMKLKGVGQKERMDTLDHLKWIFIAMGIVGLACAIVGLFAYLVKGAQ